MSGFVFPLNTTADRVLDSSLNLVTATMYAHLVTSVPARSVALVSDLAVATYTSYSSVALAGKAINSGAWVFNPLAFPYNTGSSQTVIGVVVVEQLGGSPSSTDVPLFFSRFRYSAGAVSIPVGTSQRIEFQPNTSVGFISVPGRYLFTCADYVESGDTNGAIFKIGSRNEAQAFATPSSRILYYRGNNTESILDDSGSSIILNRNLADSSNSFIEGTGVAMSMLDFGTLQLRFNTGAKIFTAMETYSGTLEVYGSNYLPSLSGVIQRDLSLWHPLGTHTLSGSATSVSDLTATKDFFRYIGFRTSATKFVKEVEFYNCTVASSTADLT